MYLRVASISVICIASAAVAEPAPMAGKNISEMVSGATVQLDTPLGTKLPVKYAANGLISGEAGALAWFLGSSADRGRWWIADDRLCHKWFKWFDAEVQCLRLKRDGQVLHWSRDDGKTGTAMLVAPEPIEPAPYALGNPEGAKAQAADASAAAATPPVAPERAAGPHAAGPAPAKSPTLAAKPQPKTEVKQSATATPPKAVTPSPKTVVAAIAPAPATPAAPARMMTAQVHAPAAAPMQVVPAAPAGQQVRIENDSFRVAGVLSNDVLNVRRGPSPEAPAVGAIPPYGQGVRLLGQCQREWCLITHNGLNGWVNRLYLIRDEQTVRR